jgi:hypothetical protein
MIYDPSHTCVECLRPATVIVDLPGAGPTQYCLACAKELAALSERAACLRSAEAAAYRAALAAQETKKEEAEPEDLDAASIESSEWPGDDTIRAVTDASPFLGPIISVTELPEGAAPVRAKVSKP